MKFKKYFISELIDEISMGPFGSNIKVECFVDKGIPVLNGSNLEGYELREDSFRYVNEEKADSLNKANAYRGDIVITHRGTLGQIVFIPQTSKYDRYVISQSQFRVRCNHMILPEYMVYYFHTRLGKYKLLSNASQVGVPALARPSTTFQKIEIEIPDIPSQKRIIAILQTIHDKIAINTKINENLEQQAQAYFVDLFITNADPNWKMGTVSDFGNVIGGGTPSKKVEEYYTSNGIAWITPKDLSNDKSKFVAHGETDITELGLAKSSATLMPKGTVLFSSRAPIGYIAIADDQVSTNQGFKSIVPFSNVGNAFVYYYLKENLSAIENVASGSTFKEVSGSTLKNFSAVIPDNETLTEFQRFCSPLFEQQRALEYENRYLATLRDTLLPKLMNGEIDVSQVQI